MNCPKCNAENNDSAKFCSICGTGLTADSAVPPPPIPTPLSAPPKSHNVALYVLIIIFLLLVITGIIGFQFYSDYKQSQEEIEKATTLTKDGKYQEALAVFEEIEDSEMWLAPWIKKDFTEQEEQLERDAKAQEVLDEAIKLESEGNIEGAKSILRGIDPKFTGYSEVQVLLNKIERELDKDDEQDSASSRNDTEEENPVPKEEVEEKKSTPKQSDAETQAALKAAEQAKAEADAAIKKAEAEKQEAIDAAQLAIKERDLAEAKAELDEIERFIDESVSIYNSIQDGQWQLAEIFRLNSYDDFDTILFYYDNASGIFVNNEYRADDFLYYRTPVGYENPPIWLYNASFNYDLSLDYLLDWQIEYYEDNPDWDYMDEMWDEAVYFANEGDYYMNLLYSFFESVGRGSEIYY